MQTTARTLISFPQFPCYDKKSSKQIFFNENGEIIIHIENMEQIF